MPAAALGIEEIPAHRSPNSGNFVCRNRNPDAGFAQQNSAVERTLSNSCSNLITDPRIVARLCRMSAEIGYFQTPGLQQWNELGLQPKSPVIGTDGNPLDAIEERNCPRTHLRFQAL